MYPQLSILLEFFLGGGIFDSWGNSPPPKCLDKTLTEVRAGTLSSGLVLVEALNCRYNWCILRGFNRVRFRKPDVWLDLALWVSKGPSQARRRAKVWVPPKGSVLKFW